MKDLTENSESRFYKTLAQSHTIGQNLQLGIGDDGAIFDKNRCIVKDVLVENVHFKREWSSFKQILHKALVSNLSDIYSMGAKPNFWLVGLVSPDIKDLSAEYIELTKELSQHYGIQLIGGDVSKGEVMMVSITLIGEVSSHIHKRSNCKPGDTLYLLGRPGVSKWVLDKLIKGEKDLIESVFLEKHLVGSHNLSLAEKLNQFEDAIAAIDLSDGLSQSCWELSRQSDVKIILKESLFRYPQELDYESKEFRLKYFLSSGEEYFPLISVPSHVKIPKQLLIHMNFFPIGEVRDGFGVEFHSENGKICTLNESTFSHFE